MSPENTNPTARIIIRPNGPFSVAGGLPLVRRAPSETVYGEPVEWDFVGVDGAGYEAGDRYTLCRCGQSQDKPFCDGTHAAVMFDGTLTADEGRGDDRRELIRGDGVVMTDDKSLCMGAGFCGTRLTNVWAMIEKTSDPEVRSRLIRMVANCPSGRLEVTSEEGAPAIEPEYTPSIAVIPNGPLWVRGGVRIQAPDGVEFATRNRVTLCRCGQSANKPYCDGAHKEIGFEAP